jgi:hypothetical protein
MNLSTGHEERVMKFSLVSNKSSKRPARIAEGTGTVYLKPAKLWYAIIDYSATKSLLMFAAMAEEKAPEYEKPLMAMLRSVEVAP